MSERLAEREKTLTDADADAIGAAILTAYPDKDVLYDLLLAKWGVRVSDLVYVRQPGALAVAELVRWARAQGRTLDLLELAWSDRFREFRPLQLLADRLVHTAPAPPPVAPVTTRLVSLETIVARGGRASLREADLRRFLELAGAVCIVDFGNYKGTGFLIGRRHVLTAHHVVAEGLRRGTTGEDVRLRFDVSGRSSETVLAAAPGGRWIGPWSPHADSDLGGEAPDADAAHRLDFAVIRLASAAPPERPVIALPGSVPIVPPGDPMVVLQYAMARDLRVGVGHLVAYSLAGERVTYEVDTSPGSGGSPVFTAAGELIALHHLSRQGDGRRVAQGVPIWRIRQAIAAAGLDPLDL